VPPRAAARPEVPSFAEQGHPELVVKEWIAFFASGRVPKAPVEATSALLREAIARPELAAAFAQAGMTLAYWKHVLRAHDIRAD